MEKVILGRKYSHPFAITGRNVSREHCELTRDGDIWTIRDLGSRHGTFIQDGKNGKLVPVDGTGIRIDPFTLICLGGISVEGCTFYAYNVFFPEMYAPIFTYLSDKNEEFKRKGERLENIARWIKLAVFAANAIVFMVSFLPMNSESRLMLLRFVPLFSTGLAALYDPSMARRRINEESKRFRYCPNPSCHEMLTERAIRLRQCRCMAT